jgi:uncharacterized membrane protein (UPF0182 family)
MQWVRSPKIGWISVILLAGWLTFDIITNLITEGLWFNELGYGAEFSLRVQTQLIVGAIVFGLSTLYLCGNLWVANLLKHPNPPEDQDAYPKYPKSVPLGWLFVSLGLLTLVLGLMLLQYGEVILQYWHTDFNIARPTPELPPRFRPESAVHTFLELPSAPLKALLILVFPILLVCIPQRTLLAIAILLSYGLGIVLSSHWARILAVFNPTSFHQVDPLFNQDISFYIFSLPVLHLLEFWLVILCVFSLLGITIIYLLSGRSLALGSFPGFSPKQRRHLQVISAAVMFSVAYSYALSRYELLYSPTGVIYGASFTDIYTQKPMIEVLSILAAAYGIFLLGRSVYWAKKCDIWRNLIYVMILYLGIAGVSNYALPALTQRLIVQPNELGRETPFITRSIEFTRSAFNLDKIEVYPFNPEGQLTVQDLLNNKLTLDNIRLWDTRPLLQTNRQLQQIRLYYKFLDADIERYTFRKPDYQGSSKQQVILAPRELDYEAVPQEAKTWVNQHLVYTHGYGFTMSPVNTVAEDGLPEYYVKDIGAENPQGETTPVWISEPRIRDSIPIGQPRIYYGELTNTYIMTPSTEPELDYPQGDANQYNFYDGTGGVPIASRWRRWLFAKYLKDWQMLLTQSFTPETKVLFRRNIIDRVKALAPFLQFDQDPYLVVANTDLSGDQSANKENFLYWIIDGYTTSDRYPYSDPGELPFNYIRNSVKVVIDAYNGRVYFFIADDSDPIIQTLAKIFPNLFRTLEDMPPSLRVHIRYPVDLFNIQSNQLLTYHMRDPQVFYNREDQWRVPLEIYGGQPQTVEPYYLIIKLPTENREEFILLHPFTPASRNNLIAWLSGRSDGENYGKLLLYQFSKQQLIYGPEQIDALINQDPEISRQISLWDRQGSKAIQGNLLIIPIEKSLLYVEPLYLEAEQNSLPTLVRVIVAYNNQIVMANTLDRAINAIFNSSNSPSANPSPTVIRNLDEIVPP